MISIRKLPTAPTKLTKEGTLKTAAHLAEFLDRASDFHSGQKTLRFATNIYSHHTVKNALIAAQHRKCCFCERLVGHNGNVVHFRPIIAYAQTQKPEFPGYYWLAYDWHNLYLSCASCKQHQKPHFFPIADPTQRAHLLNSDITKETPLLIDPGQEEPSDHLSFRAEMPFAVNGSKKGKTTIRHLGLDRPTLNDSRQKHLQTMKTLYQVILIAKTNPTDQNLQILAAKAEKILLDAVSETAEFSAATRIARETNFAMVL